MRAERFREIKSLRVEKNKGMRSFSFSFPDALAKFDRFSVVVRLNFPIILILAK